MARYELLERIGVGGMAEIFRGMAIASRGFKKPVAIKRILPNLSEDSRFVELLITEAKTLSGLRHRNIVQIYDVGLGDDGQYFLVMEYVDGLDLAVLFEQQERQRQPVPLDVALYIGAEICEALEHAHNARNDQGQLINLVHRDVSPSNILLSRSGEVKLTDFGIAKRVEERTGHGGVRGKFAYIPPEQANNQHVDGRSDVHSLAMVLFEMISGQRLFSHLPDFDALRAVREHQIPSLSSVDPSVDQGLNQLIMRALAPDPDDRYQSASEFAFVLREYRYDRISSSGDPVQAVAHTVRNSITPRRRVPPIDSVPDGEGTVVRIISSGGRGAWLGKELDSDPDDDSKTRARSPRIIDPDDVPTGIERSNNSAARDHESPREKPTQVARRGKSSGLASISIDVDPSAETRWAQSPVASSSGLEGDFDASAATRVLNRDDPRPRAGGKRRDKQKVQLPSPKRTRKKGDAQNITKPSVSSSMPSSQDTSNDAVETRTSERRRSRVLRTHVYGPTGDHERFLGMPRHLASWVIGIAGVTLLLIIIVLLATRPSAQKNRQTPEPPPSSALPGA